MKNRIYLVLILTFITSTIFAQNITGVINTYTPVTNIVNNVATVTSSAGFGPGDKVLLIQMKGATINTTNTAAFGTITAYGNAGHYEYNYVVSVNGNNITLQGRPCLTYTFTGAVQLVRVPVYNNPTVTGTLTCTPWNGTIGGVLAFEATGTLTLNGNIDVSGNGFRGGAFASSFFDCTDATFAGNFGANAGGRKGEGIAEYILGSEACRAPQANGGGGANRGNSGAGGGGNFGIGGRGGNPYSGQCLSFPYFGMTGYNLTITPDRAFMGGGGGGGYRDNGSTVSNGANGGGIVMISANVIAGNSNTISARGGDVVTVTNDEGAGAGGAGGSVYLWCTTYTSQTNVNVRGGAGGNTQNFMFTADCHGPGGGGGGGYAYFSTPNTPPNVTVTSPGGTFGVVMHNACLNQPFGADPGGPGTSSFNLPPQKIPLPRPILGNDTTVCAGQSVTFIETVGYPYPSYGWNNNSTNASLTTSSPGLYWLQVPDGCGGSYRDTVELFNFVTNINLQNDTTICPGDSILIAAVPGYTLYQWSGFNPNPGNVSSAYASQPGQYRLTITDANGCQASDTMNILGFYNIPPVNLGPDVSFCAGQSVTFDAGPGYNSYQWQNLSTNQTFTANAVGVYHVTVTNAQGCRESDTVAVISVFPLPQVNLGPDQNVCPNTQVTINAGANFTQYLWSTGETTQSITVSSQNNYSILVTDANGCQGRDTVNIQFGLSSSNFTLGSDFKLCPGDKAIIQPDQTNFIAYLWQDGSTMPYYTAIDTGIYTLTVTDVNGCNYTRSVEAIFSCPTTLFIPNCFTPNNNGTNDLFMAYGTNIRGLTMEIFNRWGELIHRIPNIHTGWNGMVGDVEAPIGQYVYLVTYVDYNSLDEHTVRGRFSLVR